MAFVVEDAVAFRTAVARRHRRLPLRRRPGAARPCGRAGGGRARPLQLGAPAARARRLRGGLARPHRRLALRRRRHEREARVDDRLRAPLQPPRRNSQDEGDFVEELTGKLAPQPPNFKRIVALNRGPLLTETEAARRARAARVQELLEEGATLIDGRATARVRRRARSRGDQRDDGQSGRRDARRLVVDPESDVVVTAATDTDARRLGRLLEAVGFRALRGFLAGGIAAWRDAGLRSRRRPLSTSPAWPSGFAKATSASSTSARTTSGRRVTSRARCTSRTTSFGRRPGRARPTATAARSRSPARLGTGARSRPRCSRAKRRRQHPPRRRRRRRRPRGRGSRARPGRVIQQRCLLHSGPRGGVAQLVRAAES